jgi:ABC-2 type transport system permease protein
VVAVYYAFTLLCAQLTGLRKSSAAFDNIASCTPYGGNYTFLTVDSGLSDIVKAITASVIFIMVMLAVTFGVFRKTEIK